MSRVFCALHSCRRSSSSSIASTDTSPLSSKLSIDDPLWNPNLLVARNRSEVRLMDSKHRIPPKHEVLMFPALGLGRLLTERGNHRVVARIRRLNHSPAFS